jgi:hypothetical protein
MVYSSAPPTPTSISLRSAPFVPRPQPTPISTPMAGAHLHPAGAILFFSVGESPVLTPFCPPPRSGALHPLLLPGWPPSPFPPPAPQLFSTTARERRVGRVPPPTAARGVLVWASRYEISAVRTWWIWIWLLQGGVARRRDEAERAAVVEGRSTSPRAKRPAWRQSGPLASRRPQLLARSLLPERSAPHSLDSSIGAF